MDQIFLMTVGFSLSGKSRLVKRILKKFPKQFFVIDTRSIHDYLNQRYDLFLGDNTIEQNVFDTRQKATKEIQNDLLKVVVEDGFSIIKDSCNLSKSDRKAQIELVKSIKPNIKTAILYVNPSEKQLLKTIKTYDERLLKKGEKPAWMDLYQKVQKNKIKIPDASEVDYFFEYNRKSKDDMELAEWLCKIKEQTSKIK